MTKMKSLFSKIKINPLFWFVLGIGVVTGYFREVIMVFLIVFIHEMGHAFAVHFFKWRIYKIELLPFGGVADIEDSGNRPFHEELIIILAGPFQHIWMILLSFIFLNFSFWSAEDHQLFVWHNMVILVFNFIPVLPLDGGRLLQLLLTYHFSFVRALSYTRFLSALILALLILISLWFFPFHLNLWIVLSFLGIVNYLEWKQRHYRFIRFLMSRRDHYKGKSRTSIVPVRDSTSLHDVMKNCRRGHRHSFTIFQPKKGTSLTVKEEVLLDLYFNEKKPQAPLNAFPFQDWTHS
ncbi:protease [bacterium LRH843]|nr:protease [bacterium LRH843]